MILCHLEVEIFPKLDFRGDHLKKWHKPISRLKIIPRSITNNIPRKFLIKMESGGVCMVTNTSPLATCVNYNKSIICSSKNGGHFEFRIILTSGHIKTLSNRFSTLETPYWTF